MKSNLRSRISTRRHSLIFVSLLLLLSAVLRTVHSGEGWVARAADTPFNKPQVSDSQRVVSDITKRANELVALLEENKSRSAQLDEREKAIDERLRALTLAQSEIKSNLAELEAAENALKATMALASSAAENDLTRLTSVYENMKPKEAAKLFAEMAPEFAAGFLARMRPDAAAAIFAGLDAQTAYSISVIMAGRNANAPTQ